MFIHEAAKYVGLEIPQFRKYVYENKIRYVKSNKENYYCYNIDDLKILKQFLNIIGQYQNKNFNIDINEDVYKIYKIEIDKEYIKNLIDVRNIFSLEEYRKYKSILDKKRGLMVKCNCSLCKQETNVNILKIKNMSTLDIECLICNECQLNKKRKEKLYKKELEKQLKKKKEEQKIKLGTKDNPILWDDYNIDNYSNGSKKWIKITCSECNKEAIIQIRKFENRKYGKGLPICSSCIMKYTTNLDEWKKINSEAQLIAQNKPEVKEKMRKIITDKIKNDYEFRRKITRYSGKLCGYYNEIKFDSSWELSILHYYGDKIKPCETVIPYTFNNKQHLYLPDFDLYLNNKKYLVEVKGQYRESDFIKIETAKKEIKKGLNDYNDIIVIDKHNIKNLEGIIIFDSIEKLEILDPKKLTILKYPKSWNKK